MITAEVMHVIFVVVSVLLALMAGPFVWRVVAGPTVFDRVIALNAIGTLLPVLLVFVGLLYERADMLIDLALALFLLNLFTTLLIAKYVREKKGAVS